MWQLQAQARNLRYMKKLPLVLALGLLALAFNVTRALFVHDGVGATEWVVGLGVVGMLVFGTQHYARLARHK